MEVCWEREVPHIINRMQTDWCPLEKLCRDCRTPEECLRQIEDFMQKQNRNRLCKRFVYLIVRWDSTRRKPIGWQGCSSSAISYCRSCAISCRRGGLRWLPIYFFTLIGACKYGWRMGLLTAVVSPLLNTVLFGMPAVAGLPAILLKSTLLALIAGMLSERCERVTLGLLVVTVLGYQGTGFAGRMGAEGSLCGRSGFSHRIAGDVRAGVRRLAAAYGTGS